MPRYRYRKLRVMCYHAREFGLDQIREAVAYLSTIEQTNHVGLAAIGTITPAGCYKLIPEPMLNLAKIIGRTQPEVWDLFDRQTDEWIEGLTRRGSGVQEYRPQILR